MRTYASVHHNLLYFFFSVSSFNVGTNRVWCVGWPYNWPDIQLSDLRYPAGYSFIRPDILPFLVAGFRSNIRHCEDFRHPAAGNPAWAGPISNWTPASSKGRIFANTGYLNRPYTRNWLNWLFCTILSSRKIWIF